MGWSSHYSWYNRDNSLKTCPEACLPGDFRLCHRQWVLGKKWLFQVSAHKYTHLCVQYTGTRVLWCIRNLCLEPTLYSSVLVPHEPGFCLQPMACPGPGLQHKPISHPILLHPLSGILLAGDNCYADCGLQYQGNTHGPWVWVLDTEGRAWCWAASWFSVIKQQCCAPSSRTLAELFGKGSEMAGLESPMVYSWQIFFFLSRWWLLVLLVYSSSLF